MNGKHYSFPCAILKLNLMTGLMMVVCDGFIGIQNDQTFFFFFIRTNHYKHITLKWLKHVMLKAQLRFKTILRMLRFKETPYQMLLNITNF